jgi:hypothetical protein
MSSPPQYVQPRGKSPEVDPGLNRLDQKLSRPGSKEAQVEVENARKRLDTTARQAGRLPASGGTFGSGDAGDLDMTYYESST